MYVTVCMSLCRVVVNNIAIFYMFCVCTVPRLIFIHYKIYFKFLANILIVFL